MRLFLDLTYSLGVIATILYFRLESGAFTLFRKVPSCVTIVWVSVFTASSMMILSFPFAGYFARSAPVTLSRKIFGCISEIEMGMRPEENPSESVFVGKITRMVDPRKTVNDEPAKATMVFLDDSNKMRKASFMLSGDDLNSAHDAFKARKDVAVRGVLKTNGKASRIEDIARFRILDV